MTSREISHLSMCISKDARVFARGLRGERVFSLRKEKHQEESSSLLPETGYPVNSLALFLALFRNPTRANPRITERTPRA